MPRDAAPPSPVRDRVERAKSVARALGALFVQTRVPIIAVRADGAFVAANDAAVHQYGYALEELVCMSIQDLQASERPIDDDLRRAHVGDPAPLEPRPHRRKDGSVVWVVPSAGPITIDGETYVVSVLKDVTAVKEAEQRVRDATEASLRDRQLVLNAVVAMLAEPELEPALQVLARSYAQGVGRAATVWLPEREGSRKLFVVAAHDIVTEQGQRELPELRIDLDRDRFGGRAWDDGVGYVITLEGTAPGTVEHTMALRLRGEGIVAPLMGRDGPHGLIYALARPGDDLGRTLTLATTLGTFGGMIIEAVQLEARAKAQAARAQFMWQAASERLSDGIALLDAERRVLRVNSAERALLVLEEPEILGRGCHEVFSLCREGRCPHVQAREEGRRVVNELRAPKTGKPLRNEVIPLPPNETDIAFVHVTHDLTEERAIRSQLVTTDRLATIGRLAAGVAHEINNPAAFVTVNLGVLRDRFQSGTARTQDVLAILEESLNGMDRIREIVRDLKGFARERAIDVVDVATIAQSAIRMAAHETRGRARVELHAEEGAVARVRGARVAQVILNLVVNAAQAIPPGRGTEHRIVLRTRREGDRVRIEVADTGPGIDPKIADRIFEPFFTTRERSGGTGLGLWLARGIVDDEGGSLTFYNAPEGGACFVVDLPAAPDGAIPAVNARESVRMGISRG